MKKRRIIYGLALLSIISLLIVSCGSNKESQSEQNHNKSITQPTAGAGKILPEFPVLIGEVYNDSSDSYYADLNGVTEEQFNDYVSACQEIGFTENYDYDHESYFMADDKDGKYTISISLYENTMDIDIHEITADELKERTEDFDDETEATTEESEEVTTKATTEKKKESSKTSNEIDPDFKAMMDSYEEFFDKYVDFMNNYDSSDVTMLAEYADMMTQYADYTAKLDDIDEDELNDVELAYYIDANARIQKKILTIKTN